MEQREQTLQHEAGFERLDREECLRLLEIEDVGRLALVQGRNPVIFPVNYVLEGEDVVFRTGPGTKLDHGTRAPVAFEIDGLDREARTGWSVLVTGRLDEVTSPEGTTPARVRRLGVQPWAAGERQHWMRLVSGTITGRRVGPPRGDGA